MVKHHSHNNTNHHQTEYHDQQWCHGGPPVCKHLLAVTLLPFLITACETNNTNTHASSSLSARPPPQNQHPPQSYNGNPPKTTTTVAWQYCCPQIETMTEKEFATVLVDYVL